MIEMTLEERFGEEVYRFRKENISHNSAEEFFRNRGMGEGYLRDFRDRHLRANVFNLRGKDFVECAELLLAQTAIQEGCEYVTNIDYCQADYERGNLIIAATGWKKFINF
jgi:hypothetical protein